ncbi:transcriptional regulator, AraC family [Fodinibius roseus]|uniref:Transcriptional regulator, AraC family n=1 Tax=Fodinibius roseus TaxID=1194090 RepID=A0A1M4YYJ5_9BACT|nr:AraC family transcriptional regulator [Fodinibius roseus]SHF10562.1 transcriptional regulator, AraC family [Fodinibius roseus]
MKRYVQFEPFIIEDFETDHWDHPKHRHNHFEVILIMHGSGKHIVDEHEMDYTGGDLFLLRPEDSHEFNVDQTTRFIYFKFTQLYVSNNNFQVPENWNREIDLLLRKSQVSHGSLIHSAEDIAMTRKLMEMISMEWQRSAKRYKETIFQLFSVILTLIKRNQSQPYEKFEGDDTSRIESILYYIECNIHDPDALSAAKIADEFYLSPNYIGSFFKRNMEVTLSDYISEYRYKLIEQRLRYSQDSISEIAMDFGFFDASHLNKFFKKHFGDSPSDYRIDVEQKD